VYKPGMLNKDVTGVNTGANQHGHKHVYPISYLKPVPRQVSNVEKTPICIETKDLRVLLLNVCGVRSKLKGVELENCINEYDIIMLTETKLCDASSASIRIPGYKLIPNNRKKAKTSSGGVAALIKVELLQDYEIVKGTCDFVLWLRSNKMKK
jgi:hypothetical protein